MDAISFSNGEPKSGWNRDEEGLFENLMLYKTKKQSKKEQAEQAEQNQEVYRGIIHYFSSPYHLYLRVDDLNKPTVRFIVFSMGKTKIMMSGIFSFRTGKFHIIYSCDYRGLKRLNQYIEILKEDYVNTLNIVKNRVDKRVGAFLGSVSNFNYPQTKLWLSFQPESRYYETQAREDRLKRLDPVFVRQLYDSDPSLHQAKEIEEELMHVNLLGDNVTVAEMEEQISDLRRVAIDKLDDQVAKAENRANFTHRIKRDKTIVDISQRFYRWISFHPIEEAQLCTDESETLLFGEDLT